MFGSRYGSFFEKPLLKQNEPGVKRITVEGASGYVPFDEAYRDTITITPTSVSYEAVPEADARLSRSWAYETGSLSFAQAFHALAEDTCCYLHIEDGVMLADAGTVTITAAFEDGRTESRVFCPIDGFFDDYFARIRQMIPACEGTPLTLITYGDDPDGDEQGADDRES